MIHSMQIVCGVRGGPRHELEVVKRFIVTWLDDKPIVIIAGNLGKPARIFGEGETAEYVPKTAKSSEIIAREQAGEPWHITLSLRCGTCGLKAKRRWDSLRPQLEKFAARDESQVPLAGIRRIL